MVSKTDGFIADWLNHDASNSLGVVYVFVLLGSLVGLIAFSLGVISVLLKTKTRFQGTLGIVFGLAPLFIVVMFVFGLI